MKTFTYPARWKKVNSHDFFYLFFVYFFFENPAPDKILKQTKTPAPIKF